MSVVTPLFPLMGLLAVGILAIVWFAVAIFNYQIGPVIITVVALIVAIILGSGYFVVQRILRTQKEETGRLNAILSSIADGVIVQDLDGNIVSMNPSARQILDTLGQDFSTDTEQVSAEKRQAQAQARLSSMLNYLAGLEYDDPQAVEIGRRVLNARSAPVVTPDGDRFGAVFVLRDITSEVESKQLKDDFITSISHELRTPLAVIKSSNDLLQLRATMLPDEQGNDLIDTIGDVDKNIAELLTLIEQMLDLTQINAGSLGIDQEPIDLAEVVRAEVEAWEKPITAKGLTYQLELPEEPVWVDGDELRLMRVMRNLLKNAYSYTMDSGSITVSVQANGQQAQVDVKDTGVGIAEKHQPFIFARFFRAIHAEPTFEIAGGGLGLFLSQAIIEAHGGRIWFESELNQGSTFSFALPMIEEE